MMLWLLVVIGWGCTPPSKRGLDDPLTQNQTSANNLVVAHYPKRWLANRQESGLLLRHSLTKNEDEALSVAALADPLPNLPDFANQIFKGISNSLTDYKESRRVNVQFAGVPATLVDATIREKGALLHLRAYAFLKNRHGFVIEEITADSLFTLRSPLLERIAQAMEYR